MNREVSAKLIHGGSYLRTIPSWTTTKAATTFERYNEQLCRYICVQSIYLEPFIQPWDEEQKNDHCREGRWPILSMTFRSIFCVHVGSTKPIYQRVIKLLKVA